ncbi:DUF1641 domain-containing protein [Pseudenhygromyxa sp. WMMC2535]|uniref:DUF1641 domain-containing protein n=1 Tax=Pseudenhygromyxa sp. WMMC2535 TaxID=2712867 RepID=UPI001554D8DC|nr:DUF1641 domain-containing protein [Pseudenhygromyxa sp. WMMC2535]NVB38927.1 DUF1641 domain-containing protein [Pseudenhygromyxa sp. WMMC2535]
MNSPSTPSSLGSPGALERIEAKLDRIESKLARLDPLLELYETHGPGLVAMAGDTFDELARDIGDLDERIKAALKLVERMTRTETLAQLNTLLEIVETAPGLVAMAGDTFDELARSAAERGLELDRVLPEIGLFLEAMMRLISNHQFQQIQELLQSDLLLPGALDALGQAARAMAHARRAPELRPGLFGVLAAMREPEVQRTLGFALDVARRFGANVEDLALPPAED